MSRAKKPNLIEQQHQRASLVAAIARDVAYLVERDEAGKLGHVIEATGFADNGAPDTSESLGAAIVALAAVIGQDWLEDTAHAAAFHRHLPNRRRPGDGSYERADAIADQVLRDSGVNVEQRNAEIAEAEESIMSQAVAS